MSVQNITTRRRIPPLILLSLLPLLILTIALAGIVLARRTTTPETAMTPEPAPYVPPTINPALTVTADAGKAPGFTLTLPFPKQYPYDVILTNKRNVPVVAFQAHFRLLDKDGKELHTKSLSFDNYYARTAKSPAESAGWIRRAQEKFEGGSQYFTGMGRDYFRFLPKDAKLTPASVGAPDPDIWAQIDEAVKIEASVAGVLYADGKKEGQDLTAFDKFLKESADRLTNNPITEKEINEALKEAK